MRSILETLNQYATLILVAVTIVYVIANWMLVREIRHQRLQEIAPYVRLVFQKAPDKVLVENVGAGIAAKVMLQGFLWKENGETQRCTFEPVYTVLPGQTAPLAFAIDMPGMEGRALYGDRTIFQIAFQQALHVLADVPMVLYLCSEDVLGNGYQSQVLINSQDWYIAWKQGKEQRWLAVTLPPSRQRRWWFARKGVKVPPPVDTSVRLG